MAVGIFTTTRIYTARKKLCGSGFQRARQLSGLRSELEAILGRSVWQCVLHVQRLQAVILMYRKSHEIDTDPKVA